MADTIIEMMTEIHETVNVNSSRIFIPGISLRMVHIKTRDKCICIVHVQFRFIFGILSLKCFKYSIIFLLGSQYGYFQRETREDISIFQYGAFFNTDSTSITIDIHKFRINRHIFTTKATSTDVSIIVHM